MKRLKARDMVVQPFLETNVFVGVGLVTCYTKLCEKNGHFFVFLRHVFYCVFESFTKICTLCGNYLPY